MFPKEMPVFWRTYIVGQSCGLAGGMLLVHGLNTGEWNLVAAAVFMVAGGIATVRGYARWLAEADPSEIPPNV